MRTSPSTIFTMNEKKTSGADIHWVVKLTDGTSTWYFGDTMMELTEGFVYPLLSSNWTINEMLDPLSKTWSVGTLTITLHNHPYKKDTSSDWVRASDILGDIRGNEATLYCVAGSGARVTALASTALDKFNGIVIAPPKYSHDQITIQITDKLSYKHTELPTALVSSVWPDAPPATLNEKIPLVYGTFTSAFSPSYLDVYTGRGLARAIKVDITWPGKYVISDHVLNSYTSSYYPYEAGWAIQPPIADDTANDLDDSGYGTVTLSGNADLYYPILDNDDTGFTPTESLPAPTDATYAYDGSLSTKAKVYDSEDNVSYHYGRATYRIRGTLPGDVITVKMNGYFDRGDFDINTDLKIYLADIPRDSYSSYGLGVVTLTSQSILNYETSGVTDDYGGVNAIYFLNQDAAYNDQITDNYHMFSIYHALLIATVHYQLTRPNDSDVAYVWCTGRKYGTWIDDHSASAYSSTDLIDDPAGIIESILIDELGLTTADIDMDSFDNAENTSVEMRVNLHSGNKRTSDQVIKKIAEQSTFAFCFTAAGKARLIALNDSSPTTNLIIPRSHIVEDSLLVEKSDNIINKLVVNSRLQQEYGNIYRDQATFNDATSQALSWGTQTYNANWDYLSGASVTHVGEHLVKATTGIWSNDHNKIGFTMKGLTGARLEIGDWIELDSASMDGYLLCGGESWSGKQFRVTGLSQNPYSTKVTAIEL